MSTSSREVEYEVRPDLVVARHPGRDLLLDLIVPASRTVAGGGVISSS
ncbi:hypothetical protein [Amycolatopsis sp. MEPSY49]